MYIFKLFTKIVVILILFIAVLIFMSIPLSVIEKPGDLLAVDNSQALQIDNVNIIDVVTGEISRNKQVLIIDGKIAEINPAGTPAAEGFERKDVNGAYMIPGLMDMHVHIHDRKYLGLYLAYGVTSVRNMRGLPMHLRWKDELENGEWLGSNIFSSSPVLDGEKYAHALQQVVTSPEEARNLVRQYKADGYDMIKAYGYLNKDVFDAIINEAKTIGIPVTKHGPNPVEGAGIINNAGLQSLEHVEDIFQGLLNFSFDQEELDYWARELKSIKPTITPTLSAFDHLTQLSERKQDFIDTLPLDTINPLYKAINREFEVKRWLEADDDQIAWNKKEADYLLNIAKTLDKQDIKLLVGSDAGVMYMPAGTSTHKELALMFEAGISAQKILQAATINAAQTLGIATKYGTVEPGKFADLVIVKGNPLEDLTVLKQPEAVIKNGQWISDQDIKALKESGKHPSNFYISMGRLLEDLLSRAL